nr:histidine kinase 3 [Tanacetum cinerariifolium]
MGLEIIGNKFLATVSHEIRTPMNGVLGMLDMLIDTVLDVTQQDYVRIAQASGITWNHIFKILKEWSGKSAAEVVNLTEKSNKLEVEEVIEKASGHKICYQQTSMSSLRNNNRHMIRDQGLVGLLNKDHESLQRV